MPSSARDAIDEASSVIYLRIDESVGSFGWEIRRYARETPLEASNRRFKTETMARNDGLPAFIRYASHPYL